jgi:BR-signaling kinase
MDSSLEGQYANDDATKLVELASKCLQFEARERPDIKFLLTAVTPLQKQKEVFSFQLRFLLYICYLSQSLSLRFTFKIFIHNFFGLILQVASHVLMGLTKAAAVLPLPTMLSPLGKACARMDLTAIHDILLKTGYKDEEGAENEVCQYHYILPSCFGLIIYHKTITC